MATDRAQYFYQINRTVLEMLKTRGYNIPQVDLDMTLEEFRKDKGDSPRREDLFNIFRRAHSTDQIMVFYAVNPEDPSKAISVKEITE